ncbi:MAG TPA: bifunctional diaminohydroxyphosphoribosylaminopyrimidine deaminase/5-amino-6-(5-phosphoribosylamino)uracil reductase RibD, partial [Planctomycetes bacterium]|nr:bifunctional diaminohydroxyphosphoribosylaminopyrimidine deaminase/5-amino-6-(5-phosphoribosylamino)uracil reductase RibD [Planctomycetota bacterium]
MNREALMRRALELAARGVGEVEPNPRVGALVLSGGRAAAEGWHGFWGGPHAEAAALEEARRKGIRPDTLVVTLEPCSTWGKTPPCTEAVLRSGVKRVVCGAVDPNPRHAGRGLRILEEAGIRVEAGILEEECLRAAGPFTKWLSRERPWLVGKWAMSLDGKIATREGSSKWITPEPLRALAHRLRSRVDAVMVGLGTVLADDPELTVRLVEGGDPAAVVVDPGLGIPVDRKIVASPRERPRVVL